MSKFAKAGLICFTLFNLFFSKVHGQSFAESKITISKELYTVSEALQEVRKQGFNIAYSEDKVPETKVRFTKSEYSIEDFLKALRAQSGIRYSLSSGIIAISYTTEEPTKKAIRGIIRDAESGEVLFGASVYKLNSSVGVISNKYGYYSLSLDPGSHLVKVSFIGYQSLTDTITLGNRSRIKHFKLEPRVERLSDVIVSGIEPDVNITSMIPGVNTINLSTDGQIPYFLGEVDILQGATLLPGINTLGEDANGLNIRGGSVDQNLILLDEAIVYNPNHLYGLISIFNPEAVNSVEIMKGFIPPSYGGRASSVISVHQKEGNDQEFHFTGGLGLVSARFIAEGPLKKDESSFILSGRQSLLDISLDNTDSRSNFRDLNAKVNWRYNRRNTVFLSAYYGDDRNINDFETDRRWGNQNIALRWNHLFGKRIFGNFSAIVSQYNYKITQPQEAASFIGQSRIIDYTLKSDFGFVISPEHEIKFGGSSIFHRLKPGDRLPFDNESSSDSLLLDSEHGLESALYFSHQANLNRNLTLLYGLRVSALHNIGSSEEYSYDPSRPRSDESITDTTRYETGEIIDSYVGLEPRVSMVYTFDRKNSIKASYTKTYQYLHLISNTITPSPTDIWKLSDRFVPPTASNHFSLGYYRNFENNAWEAYIDGYYKYIKNLVAYKDGADLLFNENPETELLTGEGQVLGLEFFLKKNTGKFTGWLSYTLSKSEIKVDGRFDSETINEGNFFPTNYDRRHDLSLVGIYQFFPRLSGSFSFSFNSGRPFTLPLGKYNYEGNLIPHFGERNQSRLPEYHRLDLSLRWTSRKTKKDGSPKKIEDYWTLVVYNVYGRNNVYSYFFDQNTTTGETIVRPYSIFDSVIPGITYHFRF